MNFPLLILVGSFALMWLSSLFGARLGERRRKQVNDIREDFNTVLAATLTLLGLIIGFSFSMATGRYDLRKNYEEAEANAIGTEYVRVDLLPAANGAELRSLLRQYTDLRIRFYTEGRFGNKTELNDATSAMQERLWIAASRPAIAQQTPVTALAVAGMNDVINSQGYTQAAWWNRIPTGAWLLMFAIALFCNGLLGYGAKKWEPKIFLLLPAAVAVSFFLIADIDSPRGGIIRVIPQNLIAARAGLN